MHSAQPAGPTLVLMVRLLMVSCGGGGCAGELISTGRSAAASMARSLSLSPNAIVRGRAAAV